MTGDQRRAPFLWVTVAATKRIRAGLTDDDAGLTSVLAVYLALAEIANQNRARTAVGEAGESFVTERRKVAAYAGVSVRTVTRAAAALERMGLLAIERPENQGRDQVPSRYVLTEPDDPESNPVQDVQGDPVQEVQGTTKEVKAKAKKYGSVNRKAVSEAEYSLVAAVVSSFNSIAGTRLSAEANLTPIVMRIRERPELKAEHHRKVIEAVFAGNHWWDDPAGIQIVYGNAAIFEKSIELARAAAKKKSTPKFDVNAEAKRIRKAQGLD